MKSQHGHFKPAFSSGDFVNAGVKREKFDLIFADMFPMRILVVEDDYISRRVMTMFLNNLGYEPDCVESGHECLDEAVRKSYDLILVDIDMPERAGFECIGELRGLHLDVFVVAVTTKDRPNVRDFCLAAGADSYLPKPFDGNELKMVLLDTFAVVKQKWSVLA